MHIKTRTLAAETLERADESKYAVLASGGPLMRVVSVEVKYDDVVCVCVEQDGKLNYLNARVLRSLVAFDWKGFLL